jgi:hypothetical protein
MPADSSGDQWNAATDNIRETTKWLITAFAAPVAIIVGTSPLTNFGTLRGPLLLIAVVAAGIGVAVVLYAIKLASDILVMKTFFLSDIESNVDLIALVDSHANILLPSGIQNFAEFLVERNSNIEELSTETDEKKLKELEADYAVYQRATFRIVGLCNREQTRSQFEKMRGSLMRMAFFGVIAFGTFSWTTSVPDASEKKPIVQVICTVPDGPATFSSGFSGAPW